MSIPPLAGIFSSAADVQGAPLAGTFHWEMSTDQWTMSEDILRIHGYRPGDVVPSMGLIQAHQHADDRSRFEELWDRVTAEGGFFCSYHRIRDARLRERRVLVTGEGLLNAAGSVSAVRGLMVDMSGSVQKETEQASREAVLRASATRGTIERAKGFLMGFLGVDSETAFRLLISVSSRTNTKLAAVATRLVDDVDTRGARQAGDLFRGYLSPPAAKLRAPGTGKQELSPPLSLEPR